MKIENINQISTGDIVKDENGNVLLLYRLNGILGMIFDKDDMPNVKPVDTNGCGRGFYSVEEIPDELSREGCATIDDLCTEYVGVVDVVSESVVNDENEQCLIYDFVSLDYYQQDLAKRMLITETDRYYDWESDRVIMIDEIDKKIDMLLENNSLRAIDDHFKMICEDDWREITHDELVNMIVKEVKDEWHEMWNDNHGEVLDNNPDKELIGMVEKEIEDYYYLFRKDIETQ